jgi:ApaG protein
MASFRQSITEPTVPIVVRVVSMYRPEESDLSAPDEKKYVFSYHIEIENQGDRSVQLLYRHWWILDADDRVREVEGEGVVGQKPVINPGQTFTYSSFCVLPTSSGWMRGTYQMALPDGERVDIPIPTFSLATSKTLN